MFLHPLLVYTKGKAYGIAHSFGCKTNPVTPPPPQKNKQTKDTNKLADNNKNVPNSSSLV